MLKLAHIACFPKMKDLGVVHFTPEKKTNLKTQLYFYSFYSFHISPA